MKLFYTLKPNAFAGALLRIMGILILFNLGAIYLNFAMGFPKFDDNLLPPQYLISLFDFHREDNIPTFFSFFLLALSAGLLFFIARVHRYDTQKRRRWQLLGGIFIFLSLDELLSIHEVLMRPTRYLLRNILDAQEFGVLYFAWFIPYGFALLFIVLYFLRFVFSLPRIVCAQFILAGVIFVSGAVGMEMIEGKIREMYGYQSILYHLAFTIEETLEMGGIILFIKSLLTYLKIQPHPASLAINLSVQPVHKDASIAPLAKEEALS